MTATVVHVQRPTSVEAGNVALVLADGTIEGFVGGVCTEHSVRAYALQALQSGKAVLLRILPFAEDGEGEPERRRPPRTARSPSRIRACREARSRCSWSPCCPRRGCSWSATTPIAERRPADRRASSGSTP